MVRQNEIAKMGLKTELNIKGNNRDVEMRARGHVGRINKFTVPQV